MRIKSPQPAVNRLPYEKPLITVHSLGATNKYIGRVFSSTICQRIDGVDVTFLTGKYGSPLYVVSEENLRIKYRDFIKTLRSFYPDTYIAYSYKTNYLTGICSIFHQEGAWAEVVSGFEYDIALDLGLDPAKIVFNGPYKKKDELLIAIRGKSMINIDSYNEIYHLGHLSITKANPVKVGVRINMNLNYPPWNKFGFNLESGQAFEACRRIVSTARLKLNGLHCHLGTYIADTGIYYQAMSKLVDFALQIEKELDVQIDYLDIGGGYASANTLHTQFLSAAAVIPTFEQYASVLCQPLKEKVEQFKGHPRLLIEPGRALVDEAVSLVTTVVSSKTFADGTKAVIVDAGVNLLPTAYWFKHEIAATEDIGSTLETVNIYGPLCMQIDVIRTEVRLPPLQKGNILVIKNVGAYNITQSLQFIFPRPAVVIINNGQSEYLRLPETNKDIRHLDILPPRLKLRK